MEVSVSFTDGSRDLNEGDAKYSLDETVLGRAWIPLEGLVLTPPVRVRYEKHPWIEAFEFDGVRAAPARRKGIGTKGAKGFVKSLSTIYSGAYDDYRAFGGDEKFDAAGYFTHAAEYFARVAEDESRRKMAVKFCGFAENMWREGDREILDICMDAVIPVLKENVYMAAIMEDTVTEEFRDYLEGGRDGEE
jgi:hypothetical protein